MGIFEEHVDPRKAIACQEKLHQALAGMNRMEVLVTGLSLAVSTAMEIGMSPEELVLAVERIYKGRAFMQAEAGVQLDPSRKIGKKDVN